MIVAVIQARIGSQRFPRKVLQPILGQPMLVRQIERVRRAEILDRIVVATSTAPADDELVAALDAYDPDLVVHRGDLDDVLDRVHAAAAHERAEHVVRLTGDCPLADPGVIDLVVREHRRRRVDYTSNSLKRSCPDGLDLEVMRFTALADAHACAVSPGDREHVTAYLCRRPDRYKLHSVELDYDLSAMRWVVDYPVDLEVVRGVYERLYPIDPEFGMRDVLELMQREPRLFDDNRHLTRILISQTIWDIDTGIVCAEGNVKAVRAGQPNGRNLFKCRADNSAQRAFDNHFIVEYVRVHVLSNLINTLMGKRHHYWRVNPKSATRKAPEMMLTTKM